MPVSNTTHAKNLTKLLGEKVSIERDRIYFTASGKDIARFRLAGLPSCCGAGTVYGFKLSGRSKDGEVEKIVSEVIKNNGSNWSYLQATTRNPTKVRMFEKGGWELKAKFNSPKGATYLFQTKVTRLSSSNNDSDW